MKLSARFVVPGDGRVIEGGAVAIDAGRIADVGKCSEIAGTHVTDYGDAVLVAGFVNAHTHLELSHFRDRVPPADDLIDWLSRLMRLTSAHPPTEARVKDATMAGIEESLRFGVTTVGDISRHASWTRPTFAASPLRAVSFAEIVSIGRRRRDGGLEEWSAEFEPVSPRAGSRSPHHGHERLVAGISPHAPYSVEPEALRACASWARVNAAPICVHALESPDEDDFTRNRGGRFADFLKAIGAWDESIPTSGLGPLELLDACGLVGPRTLLAHANYATESDIARIAERRAHVAFCPRTHAAFGHPPHGFRRMLAAGLNVCIGTDSVASNPSLSVLDELRFLRGRFPELCSVELLAMGTWRGARALGFEEITGTLTVGKIADLVVLPIESIGGIWNWDTTFHMASAPLAVFAQGEQVLAKSKVLRPM